MRKYKVKHESSCTSNYGFPLVYPITINTSSKGVPVKNGDRKISRDFGFKNGPEWFKLVSDRSEPTVGSIKKPLYELMGQVIGSQNLIKAL